MTIAQGIYKTLAYKKQTGLGTAATGTGGQLLRRETATFEKQKATFNSNEITPHQQYTGDSYGSAHTMGTVNGDLSAATYSALLGSLNRADFAAGATSTSLSLTIAGAGPYTLTRAAGSYLTDGIKIGDVVRITAGTYTGTARDINLLVTNVTALVLTVIVPNGSTLSAQGPIASSTVAVIGKKTVTPSTGQTNDYYTFEEWFADITKSRAYTDSQISSADISIPANGNAKIVLNITGLGRTESASQSLTTPTAVTTTDILSGVNAAILVNGTQQTTATSLSIKIDGQVAPGESVIGAKTISDNVKGDIKVTGSFSIVKQDEANSTLFENETTVQIIGAIFANSSATSDFVSFSIPAAKLFSDKVDDGKKQIVSSHDFVAQRNGTAGGTGLATDTGIISIQDSAA